MRYYLSKKQQVARFMPCNGSREVERQGTTGAGSGSVSRNSTPES